MDIVKKLLDKGADANKRTNVRLLWGQLTLSELVLEKIITLACTYSVCLLGHIDHSLRVAVLA